MQRNEPNRITLGTTPEERTIQAAQEQNLRLRISTFPNDSHSWFLLGCVLRKQKRYKESEQALRRAVTLNPAPTVFWSELACVLQDLGHGRIDPEKLRELGAERPEIQEPDSLGMKVRRIRTDDALRKTEAIPRINAHLTSPCVSCPDYTYYGCRRQEACAELIQWRTQRS
ncbi:MAG: tetratricopeptide repeat protein [Candidatus Thorarchaeota archaeon]